MKMWRQRKTIRRAGKSIPVCLLALSILNASPIFAADKVKYLPPIAPEVDASVSDTKPAASSHHSGSSDSGSSYAPAGSDDGSKSDQVKDLLRQALERHNQGDVPGAARLFHQVLTIDPTNADANFNLGAMAEDDHDWNGALRYYTAAHKANPSDREIDDAIATVKTQLGQQAAAAQTEQKLEKKKRLAQLGQEAGLAYKAGRYDEAISKLQMVEREQPNDASTIFALGQAYRGKGDTQRAREYLKKAVALDPNNQLFAAALSLNDSEKPASAQSADGMPPTAPDFHSAHNNDAPRQHRRSDPDWQDEGWQSANQENQNEPPVSGDGVRPFTDQGENQLQGRVANSRGRGGIGGLGTAAGIGLGGAALGLGALSLFGLMRGGSQPVMPYGQPVAPYPSPYGYGMSPYSPYPPSPYGSPYGNPYGNPYRGMRIGRHRGW